MASEGTKFLWMVAERVKRGNCVLLLGPGVAVDPADPDGTPLSVALSRYLAGTIRTLPPDADRDKLRYIAQEYLSQPNATRDDLEFAAVDFYSRFKDATTDFHKTLAKLPFSVCVETSPDRQMFNAFTAAGKQPTVAHYNLRRPLPPRKPAYSVDNPVIYQLFGSADEDPESLVLTESDVVDFLVAVVKNVPELASWLRALLQTRETEFLFVGFGFHNWYLRLLLHVLGIIERERPAVALEDKSFFSRPDRVETVGFYSGKRPIVFHEMSWNEFAARLADVCSWARPPQPAGTAADAETPKVFLSYASEDRDTVETLAAALRNYGLDVWQDKDSLRAGDAWKYQINKVIGTQVNYVVVAQSRTMMLGRDEGVYNSEINVALERQTKQFEGLRFVLPVTIDGTGPMDRLADLHQVDVRTDAGVRALVAAIQQDHQARQERRRRAAQRTIVEV